MCALVLSPWQQHRGTHAFSALMVLGLGTGPAHCSDASIGRTLPPQGKVGVLELHYSRQLGGGEGGGEGGEIGGGGRSKKG